MLNKEDINLDQFPFGLELSLKPLIDYWENSMKGRNIIREAANERIKQELENAKELYEPITDWQIMEKHKVLIRSLFSVVFPEAFWDKQIFAGMHPFTLRSFIASEPYNRLIKPNEDKIPLNINMPPDVLLERRKVGIYSYILGVFYGIKSDAAYPFIYTYTDPDTGLKRYMKINLANEFMDIKQVGELKKLTDEEIELIEDNITNYDILEKLLPPENFILTGFMTVTGIDVTDQEVISAMKQDLIQKDTLSAKVSFLKMEEKVQSLFRNPNILMGLIELPDEANKLYGFAREITHSFVFKGNECIADCDDIAGSIYDQVVETGKEIIISNLERYPNKTALERGLLSQGIKNIYLAPIKFDDRIVGVLEIGARETGVITTGGVIKLENVLPLFGVAIARSMEELENKVETIIKNECTAIHPSVEWRFRKAALKVIDENVEGYSSMEDIVFKEVYPLYGLSDIRNSSTIRNEVIKEDLITNLNMVNEIIHIASSHRKLHSLDEMNYRIGKQIESINFGLASGDELEIMNFLKSEVEPLFKHIKDFDVEVKEAIESYESSIDKELGFIYNRRKAYEDSVNKLSDVIGNYLESEQIKAQEIFPHYFAKYKTDGVDHTIYIGESMVENEKFDPIYLKNLRLWQFITMCNIVRKAESLKPYLQEKLEVANLILVQDVPLSIRFRYDEKQFDVDGAYNVRYEIMKKRIDKAEIKGGEERLTQPGKIAIVYSHPNEAKEYMEHIDYMYANGYLLKEVEQLELENLQGVHGLKALRVSVDLNDDLLKDSLNKKEISSLLKND